MNRKKKVQDARRDKSASIGQKGDEPLETLTIGQAAEQSRVTRQAIYVAIRHKKLRAFKHTARWNIHQDDLQDYRLLRYSRSQSTYDGDLLYDNSRGTYSIVQTAKMLSLSPQRIYQAARKGQLRSSRKGAAWVIHIDDIRQFSCHYLNGPLK